MLTNNLPRNPELVYALLHRQDCFPDLEVRGTPQTRSHLLLRV